MASQTIPQSTLDSINTTIASINKSTSALGSNFQQLTPLAGKGIVSGSSSIVNQERSTTSKVKNLSASLPEMPKPEKADTKGLTSAFESGQTLLKNYMDALNRRRKEEVAAINTGFDIKAKDQKKAQEKEVGSTSVGLARMGGYLGGSGSGTGVMLNLAESHRDEVVALEAQRQDAIRKARQAVEDKQFQLARSMVEDAQKFENAIYQRNNDFWNRQIQYQQETRSQDKFLSDKYKEELTTLATLGSETSPEKMEEIDNFYGVEGFTKRYLEVTYADSQAKSEKAKYETFKSKMDLLKSIPKGMAVQFGDESIIGMGSAGDISSFHVEDEAGNVTLVTHNQATGGVTTQSLGQIGSPSGSGGGGGTADERAASALSEFQATFVPGAKLPDGTPVLDSDGKITPEAWKEAISDAPAKGLTRESFIVAFGHMIYDNVNNVSSKYGLTAEEKKYIVKPSSDNILDTLGVHP